MTIPSSRLGKLLACGLALGAHGALALVLVPEVEIRMEGRNGAAEAAIGSSFADMAAGRLDAESVEDVVEPEQPLEPLPPDRPEPVETVMPDPAQALAPVPDMVVAESPEPETVTAEPEPKPKPKLKPEPKPEEKPVARGNADRNARAGQAAGNERAEAATSGRGGAVAESGNAASSNYPGLVMRALSRVPKPRIRARGAAVVAFRVAADGGLASASVARSSGSTALDQAALRLVERAAPFPAPPRGAQRSFSIRIEGR
ncbi:cell envelope integrity protein TolA [Rhodovulum sp. YEN HP10]|uniref:cell envelope integrity protein TolA n=1 Tax=Rhodovulum sp. HP10 TaxID=3387397 RepID=UPI0039E09CE1